MQLLNLLNMVVGGAVILTKVLSEDVFWRVGVFMFHAQNDVPIFFLITGICAAGSGLFQGP